MSLLVGFPTRPQWNEVPIFRAFFYACRERCSISGALLPLSQFPVPRFPSGTPIERDNHLQNLIHIIPWKFIFPLESWVRVPPPCSPTGSLWRERATVCLPEPFYQMGKNIRSLSMEPHTDRRPTYNRVQPGSPRGSLTTLLSLPQCHAALSTIPSTLAWVDQSPVSQCVL